jgi:serine/threonine-protein kinase
LAIDQITERYKILEKLGEGGMGIVYRGRDIRLDRDVALKVLLPTSANDSEARERLLHEARTASRLNHPHICGVYDADAMGEQIYVAMELIEGRSLKELSNGAPLPIPTVIRYGTQVASGLAHAHEHGVIHRDLKCANVIVTPDGRAKIVDFGLAVRRVDEVSGKTTSSLSVDRSGEIAGTLPYLSPELLRGEPADERSDIWALGVIVYELATGQLPFRGATTFELSSIILCGVPEAFPPTVPVALRTVIYRCLAKEPAERYQTAGAIAQALESLDAARLDSVRRPEKRRKRRGRICSLAVLPLHNLSADPDQEYFADGMTEALITELAQIRALKVISRTSTMQYKSTKLRMDLIAQELGVDAVIEGSVIRSGNRVRITAQLVDSASDKHLWAESYDRELSEVLALQSEVARTIAAQIRVKLTPREREHFKRSRKVMTEVYESYLKGRYHFNKWTVESVKKGIEHFQQALQLDPDYAPAYAGIADCNNTLQFLGLPPSEVGLKALKAATRAVALDPSLAAAHAALGSVKFFHEWNWSEAESEFRRAIELDPGSPDAHQAYAYLLTALGRHDKAIAEIERAHELDPMALAANVNIGWRYYFARDYDKAISRLREALELDSNFGNAFWCLGLCYMQKQNFAEGILYLKRAVMLYSSNPQPKGSLGHAYGLAGKPGKAQKIVDELLTRAKMEYVSAWAIAVIYIGMGETDSAMEWLEKAYQDRNASLVWLKVNPEFDPIRSDPRFKDLLARLKLSE